MTRRTSRRERQASPLADFPRDHLLDILALIPLPKPPRRWVAVGPSSSRKPAAYVESRAWYEWHWARGQTPGEGRTLPAALRRQVIARDGLFCGLCSLSVHPDDVHIDHIQPVSLGGTDDPSNLQVTHSRCNILKGARV